MDQGNARPDRTSEARARTRITSSSDHHHLRRITVIADSTMHWAQKLSARQLSFVRSRFSPVWRCVLDASFARAFPGGSLESAGEGSLDEVLSHYDCY